MRFVASVATLIAVAGTALAVPPVPRKSPEFTIVEPSGKQTLISSLKGKVVLVSFIATTCPHCQRLVGEFTKLSKDPAMKNVVMYGVAFNPEANPEVVKTFDQQFGVGFPVGYASPATVVSYLGFSVMDRYVYPQVVIIDKKGMIRAQSDQLGTADLQDPAKVKVLLEGLLKEGGATTGAAPTAKKTTAVAKKD